MWCYVDVVDAWWMVCCTVDGFSVVVVVVVMAAAVVMVAFSARFVNKMSCVDVVAGRK
jgi:hypothetical protein